MPRLYMHITYCEQGQSVLHACKKAKEWGFDGVELRATPRNLRKPAPLTPAEIDTYLDEVETALNQAGLQEVIFGGGPNLMLPSASDRAAQIESYAYFSEQSAKRFHVKILNVFLGFLKNPDTTIPFIHYPAHGSAIADEKIWEQAVTGFKPLAKIAERLGFVYAFETHGVYLHDLPQSTRELVDRIGSPAVGVNFDYGNMSFFPKPPSLEEALRVFSGKIKYVHLKNLTKSSTGSWTMVPLGAGDINHRQLLRLFKESGYQGPLCLEAPREGDRECFAPPDLAYAKSLLHELYGETVPTPKKISKTQKTKA